MCTNHPDANLCNILPIHPMCTNQPDANLCNISPIHPMCTNQPDAHLCNISPIHPMCTNQQDTVLRNSPINQMPTFVTTRPFNVYRTAKQQPSANSYQPIVHVVPQYCVIFTSSCITFHPWVPKASSSGHICPVSVFCPPPTGPDQTRNSQHSKCCL